MAAKYYRLAEEKGSKLVGNSWCVFSLFLSFILLHSSHLALVQQNHLQCGTESHHHNHLILQNITCIQHARENMAQIPIPLTGLHASIPEKRTQTYASCTITSQATSQSYPYPRPPQHHRHLLTQHHLRTFKLTLLMIGSGRINMIRNSYSVLYTEYIHDLIPWRSQAFIHPPLFVQQ